jgi:hypothetical protein
MLLDLRSLLEDPDAPRLVIGGSTQPFRAPVPVRPRARSVYQDLGLLVSGPQTVQGLNGGKRIWARDLQFLGDLADVTAVEAFRAAARWADQGTVFTDSVEARGTDVFVSGAPKIAAADDDLLLLGDL